MTETSQRTSDRVWMITAAVLITGLYVYALVAAIGNLIGMPQVAATLGVPLSASGWAWTIIGVALAPVAYLLALMLGRNQRRGVKILLLLAGLCLVAVLQLDIMHLIPRSSYFG